MPSGFPLQVGDRTANGWLVTTEVVRGGRFYQCPFCTKKIEATRHYIAQKFSCGCTKKEDALAIPRVRYRPEDYPALIQEAIAAFKSDYRYGEEIAKVASRIREHREQNSPML